METNIYEDAIMDICKKQKQSDTIMVFMNELINGAKFEAFKVNNDFLVVGTENGRSISFAYNRAANFPGEELVSNKLIIFEGDKNDNANYIYGRIIVTYHEDIDQWTVVLHLLDEEKEINRIERIVKIDALCDEEEKEKQA